VYILHATKHTTEYQQGLLLRKLGVAGGVFHVKAASLGKPIMER
jgi:hypothetical protein